MSTSGDLKTLGFFESADVARHVMADATKVLGFRDQPEGFEVRPVNVKGECGNGQEFFAVYRMLDEERDQSLVEADAKTFPGGVPAGDEFILIDAFWNESDAYALVSTYSGSNPSAIIEVSPVGVNDSDWLEGFITVVHVEE